MSLTIKEIIGRNLLDGAVMVAGFGGKDNDVVWINIMEILDTPESVQKGEILITTGYGLGNEEKHKNLIHRLKKRGVSGMVVQLGYYIDMVPKYIITAANELDFPVLTIPSRLTFSYIMHVMVDELMQNTGERKKEKSTSLFQLLKKETDDKKISIDDSQDTYLFLIKENENGVTVNSQDAINDVMHTIYSFLDNQPESSAYMVQKDSTAAILLQMSKAKSQINIIFELTILLTFTSEQRHINFFVGVDQVESLKGLPAAYEHALECISVLNNVGAKRGVGPYDNLSFFELFGTLTRNNNTMLLGNEALRTLLSFDQTHETNYVHTLRIYLAYECNVSKTAERLYIHRHTLINRLKKIESMCKIHLEDYYTRTFLSLALVIHDYFAF